MAATTALPPVPKSGVIRFLPTTTTTTTTAAAAAAAEEGAAPAPAARKEDGGDYMEEEEEEEGMQELSDAARANRNADPTSSGHEVRVWGLVCVNGGGPGCECTRDRGMYGSLYRPTRTPKPCRPNRSIRSTECLTD
jgi:hypothetical protein